MKFKKFIAAVISVAMIISCVNFTTFAEDTTGVAQIGDVEYATLADAIAAAKSGETITLLSDVALTSTANLCLEGEITLDGTGHKITNNGATTAAIASYAGQNDSTVDTHEVTIKNVVFDGWTTDHVVRLQGVTGTVDSCTFQNCKQTSGLGLVTSTFSKSTVANCTFENNTCIKAIDVNSWGDGSTMPVLIEKCTFTGNKCSSTGIIEAFQGEFTIKNSKFVDNEALSTAIFCSTNATISGNYFAENTYTGTTSNKASVLAGPWKEGTYTIKINDNAFTDESVPGAFVEDWSATYEVTATYDLNGNYWNGGKPYYGVSGKPEITLGNYYTTYEDSVLSGSASVVTGTEEDPYLITNIDDLKWFRNSVNAGNNYKGKYVKLNADIDLKNELWTPIGTATAPFKGTFDGNEKTISNLIVTGEANQGFFGYADNAVIENVSIENATVTGTDCVGAVAGQLYSVSTIDNCHVSGNIKVTGQTNVGGIVGKYYTKVTNSSVIGDGTATSFVKGTYYASDYEGDNVGGIMGHCGENNNLSGNTVKNITVSGTRKVGGIVGIADQNTDVSGCTVENVVVETTATAEYAKSKVTSMSIGGLIGQYQAEGSSVDGTVENSTVSNVTFVIPDGVVCAAGAVTGGARGGSSGMLAPSDKITVADNTVTNVTGATNEYLMPVYVAYIGETGYETVQAAIDAAKENDTVTIGAGEFAPINISNKKITIEGTVGDNGELLTTIKGGDPAITGHSFNGTIKDIKIGEGWKVMYAEPAGNVTVDNVYVTGATYGFHLVAYSPGLTWTIQNSYMDLCWANSFGVSYDGYADIIIKGNIFESTDPYYPDYGAIHVNSFLPSVTVEENIFGKNAKIYIDANAVTDTSKINISKNYHADGVENAFADDADGVTVPIDSYYKTYTVNEDGTFVLSDLMENKLPNAEVKNLGTITVKNNEGDYKFDGSYYIFDLLGNQNQQLQTSSEPFDMQVAMEFIAKDTAEEAAKNAYGNHTTDFFIKITGLEDGSFVGNGCYLAGYYPSFGTWVKIPLDGFTIEDGVVYPVITSAGFDFKYTDICSSVQDFICGIYLSDDVIKNNPDIKVQLDLGLSETYEAAQNAEFVTVDSYVYDKADLLHGKFRTSFYVVDMESVSDDTYRIGLFSGIDSLMYQEVGFKVYLNGQYLASGSTTNVYKKITAGNASLVAEEKGVFRFFGIPVDFPTSYDNKEGLTFQPYAIDLFGKTINGRMYKIEDIYTLDEKEIN